jgi:hypothetical protein
VEGRFAEKRDVIRRIAQEALEEDERGETLTIDDTEPSPPETLSLSD